MVKLSPCLTNYQAMKTYPLLNLTPRPEDVWGNGGIVPRVINFGARWR
jgi:hypothetical protein